MTKAYFRSPLGWIQVVHADGVLTGLSFVSKKPRSGNELSSSKLKRELTAYFAGSKRRFSVKLAEKGTDFQRRVWKVLRSVPVGATRSYKELAVLAGRSKAVRAVASACARNPLMLITPCHRIIGSTGKLGGYAYGLKKKMWLLRHEGCRA